MQRATRIFIVASTVLAGIAHGWLVVWHPYLAPAAVAAFVIGFLLARSSLTVALLPALLTIYVAPALLYLSFGVSDYHLTLIWLSLLAGPILAHTSLDRWHLPAPWSVLFAGWALVIAATWPIVAGREIDFSMFAARTFDSHTAMFEGAPPMAAAWIVIIAFAQMLGVLWIDLLWARFAESDALPSFDRGIVVPILLSAVLGGIATIYQGAIDLRWLNVDFWSNLRRASGLMLDANTAGISGAIWAPVSIVLVWHKRLPAWAGVFACAVLAAATWISGSRTALMALATGAAGLLVAVLQRRQWWQPRMAPIVLLVGAALIVLAMFIAPRGGNSPSPLQRVFDRLPRPDANDLSRFSDEMWTRFGYGTAAERIMKDHPVTGVGIGAFHIVVNDYLHRETGKTVPPDNAQNWWRHQIAELGALGALPSIALSIAVVALIWRGGPYVEPFGSTTVLRMILTGIGLASLFGVPTQHPATWLAFVTLLFWLVALYRGREDATEIGGGWWVTAVAIAASTAVGQAWSARADLRVPERAVWTGAPVWYGFAPAEGVSDYGELRWMARHAVRVMEVKDDWLQLAIWPPSGPPATERPALQVTMNHRDVLAQHIPPAGPVVYYLRAPERTTWTMLEFDVSGSPDANRSLAIALDWVHSPPPGAPPERIIR